MHTGKVFLAFLFACAGSASSQEVDVQAGQDLYMTYCWQCHGQNASGNGPMAEKFAMTTADLTKLTANNYGVFPLEAVARQIDGRDPLMAHGGEMPIYGPFFETGKAVTIRLSGGPPLMAGLPLANLIVYLESLQTE